MVSSMGRTAVVQHTSRPLRAQQRSYNSGSTLRRFHAARNPPCCAVLFCCALPCWCDSPQRALRIQKHPATAVCGRASTRCESINIGAVGRNQALFSRSCDWDTHAHTSSRSANGARRNQRRRRVEGAANGFGCCCGCRCSLIIASIRLHVWIPDLRVTVDSSRTQEPTGLPALASSRSSQHGLDLAALLDIFLQTAAVCCPACKKVVPGVVQ